jgi:hypothetical protein
LPRNLNDGTGTIRIDPRPRELIVSCPARFEQGVLAAHVAVAMPRRRPTGSLAEGASGCAQALLP